MNICHLDPWRTSIPESLPSASTRNRMHVLQPRDGPAFHTNQSSYRAAECASAGDRVALPEASGLPARLAPGGPSTTPLDRGKSEEWEARDRLPTP